jgi:uncharacterized protein YecE (DUF72 family)
MLLCVFAVKEEKYSIMVKIRFGTCSWKYDSWQGLVYSEKAKENYLLEYSKKYDTVEIDQWFWSLFGVDKVSLPKHEVVEEYTNAVPDDFKFTIKIPNSITLTHFYRKVKTQPLEINPYFLSTELFETFLDTLKPMYSKIGLLMFQFEYLNKQKMSSVYEFIEKFSQFIEKCDPDFNYGIEIRNPWYLNKKYFEFLNKYDLGHVFLQGYFMPDITEIYQKYWSMIKSIGAIRLHGPDRSDIEEKSKGVWNRLYEPKDDEISRITKIIEEIHSKNLDIYVNVNNHYEGSAPLTIERIRKILFQE